MKYDKHKLYSQAVQNAEFDFEFIDEVFKRLRGRRPLSLREDFCGTGHLCCEWVKQGDKHSATGIDLCNDTIQYGKQHYLANLTQEQQRRVNYLQQDVLHSRKIKSDVIVAFNFSYWVFRTRQELLKYFKSVRASMKDDSIFLFDTKGGSEVVMVGSESKRFKDFTYYWECESFNPINHECRFSIHFKPRGKPKQERAFTYHWRYWVLPEIRELLQEAGFSKSIVYMEGDDDKGEGDGVFAPMERDEDSCIWVAYIAALP